MVRAIQAARAAARKAIESTYDGIMTVTQYQKVRDESTKLTKSVQVMILESQPCRLSFERINAAAPSETATSISQTAKVFVASEVIIPPGSKITVTQAGVTTDYTHSGVAAVYDTHQEILLDLYEERA